MVQEKKDIKVKSFNKINTLIGLVVVLIILSFVGVTLGRSILGMQQKANEKNNSYVLLSPTIITQEQSKNVATESSHPAQPKITKLANTTGEELVYIRALNGDNFWRISKRVCGTKIFHDSIRRYNGYLNRVLQPGDLIAVYCSF